LFIELLASTPTSRRLYAAQSQTDFVKIPVFQILFLYFLFRCTEESFAVIPVCITATDKSFITKD